MRVGIESPSDLHGDRPPRSVRQEAGGDFAIFSLLNGAKLWKVGGEPEGGWLISDIR